MPLKYLLACVPLAFLFRWFNLPPALVFAVAALAVVPLAELMGEATEVFSAKLGPTIGGLLNATLGIAPEVIICILGLRNGLHDVVKASITGSIIANLLLGLGVSMILGGWRHGVQKLDKLHAGLNSGLLLLASIGLVVPAAFHHVTTAHEEQFSIETSLVLLVVYGFSVWFTIRGGLERWESSKAQAASHDAQAAHLPAWSQSTALWVLAGSTCTLALVSEVLTAALEPAAESMGFTPTFSGVVLLAIVGNAGEILNAIKFARDDKMDVAFSISVGAGIQVALMVAPLLVLVSLVMGKPMDLVFTPFEVVAVFLAVTISSRLTNDGECHWMEGVLLLGVYFILGMAFFNLPEPVH